MKFINWSIKMMMIPIGVLLLMVISDLIRPYKPIEVEVEPHWIIHPEDETLKAAKEAKAVWDSDTSAWHREQFENEVAFNLGIDSSEVTEEQFNQRYGASQQ